MEALVMILANTKKQTFHPIFYLENQFPGPLESELNTKAIRFKSKGHHTEGFSDRQAAVDSINNSLVDQIKSIGYIPRLEIDADLIWDGEGIPADNQIRERI